MPTISVYRPGALADSLGAAQGLLTQTWDRQIGPAGSVMIGGTAYAMLIGTQPGQTFSNVYVEVTAAASSPTLFKAGLYSLDGATRYAASADQSSLFSSSGVKAVPLASSYTATGSALFVVLVATASTTLPTLLRGGSFGNATQIGSSAMPLGTAGTALSDLPAVTVTYTNSNSPIGFWVGLA